MPFLTVPPPFPTFENADGTALKSGFVFVGEENKDPETNPITVFWDADLTQPVAQPIRTNNGFLSRAGSPARVYSSVNYSITVKDKKETIVYTSLADNVSGEASAIAFIDVAEMRAFTGNRLSDNQSVTLIGGALPGDGAGGDFFWDSSSTASEDAPLSVGTVVKRTDEVTGRFIRTDQSTISLPMFGADPTGLLISTAAIQVAFDSISNGNFRVLDLGDTGNGGFYNCDATLTLPTKTFNITGRGNSIAGAGHSTVFRFSQTDGTNCFQFATITDTSDVNFSGPLLGDFFVQGQTTGSGTNHGIALSIGDVADIEIRNIYSRRHKGNGFDFEDMFICRMEGLRASLCDIGISLDRCNQCNVEGTVDSVQEDGVKMVNGRANSFRGNIDVVGLAGINDNALLKLESVVDSVFEYYSESISNPNESRAPISLDSNCRANWAKYYSTDHYLYVDKGVDNVIPGINDEATSVREVTRNIPNGSFQNTLSNWTKTGNFGTPVIVSEAGRKWLKTTHAAGAGTLSVFNDSTTAAWAVQALAGDILTVQFTVKASRASEFERISGEEFIIDPTGGGSSAVLTNYYARHFELFNVSTNEKTYRMKFTAVVDIANLGFKITTADIASTIDIFLTDIIWGINIQEKRDYVDLITFRDDNRYLKGDILAAQNSAATEDSIICTRDGYNPIKSWAATTAFVKGEIVDNSGRTWRVVVGGTTGAGPLPAPATGVVDGTVTWDHIETSALFSQLFP